MSEPANFSALTWRDASDVALQRTAHLVNLPVMGSLSYRAWVRDIPQVLHLEAMIRRRAILNGAMTDAMREFESIADYLGRREIGQALDIGCGHAFIDLPLWRRYGCRIHLVDIEKTAARHHDWNASGAGYASLASAKQFLVTNGVPPDVIETTNPEKAPLNLTPQSCDLMMSLLSAGFHYPVDSYAKIAREALKPGGVFIFDARKEQRQEDVVADFFSVDIIAEGTRHHRLAAVR